MDCALGVSPESLCPASSTTASPATVKFLVSLIGLPSSSLISNVTVCAPAARIASSTEESIEPTTVAFTSTPSTKILPDVKSSAALSATVADNAILLPLITIPLSKANAVSVVE